MSKPILVGYDPRRADRAPVDFGVAAARFTGAPLVVVAVQAGAPVLPISPGGTQPYAIATVDEDLVTDCSEALREIEAELGAAGITVECRQLRSTSAARALHEAAEQEDAGLLVVGSSRRSVAGRVLAGSTAQGLLAGAPCPVGVVPLDWTARSPSTIGVAWVDSPEGHEALRGAHAIARRAGATLRVISVVKVGLGARVETETHTAGQLGKDLEDVVGEHMLAARKQMERAVEQLGDDVPVELDPLVGDPAEVLVDVSRHVDLLVCGSRGYGPVRAVMLGSVSRRVTAEARCPVIVLPRGVKASLEALVAEAAAPA
jgi:nucleotide-binding universal stress UspA family protein